MRAQIRQRENQTSREVLHKHRQTISFGDINIDPELCLEEPREAQHLVRVRQDAPGGGVRGEAAAPPVQQRRGGRVDEGEPVEALAGPERRQEAAERQVQEPRRRVAPGEESRAAAAVPERLLQQPQRRAGVGGRLRAGGRGRAQAGADPTWGQGG